MPPWKTISRNCSSCVTMSHGGVSLSCTANHDSNMEAALPRLLIQASHLGITKRFITWQQVLSLFFKLQGMCLYTTIVLVFKTKPQTWKHFRFSTLDPTKMFELLLPWSPSFPIGSANDGGNLLCDLLFAGQDCYSTTGACTIKSVCGQTLS